MYRLVEIETGKEGGGAAVRGARRESQGGGETLAVRQLINRNYDRYESFRLPSSRVLLGPRREANLSINNYRNSPDGAAIDDATTELQFAVDSSFI